MTAIAKPSGAVRYFEVLRGLEGTGMAVRNLAMACLTFEHQGTPLDHPAMQELLKGAIKESYRALQLAALAQVLTEPAPPLSRASDLAGAAA